MQKIVNLNEIINEPRHEISNNVVCATSKGSDQPAHMCSLIRAFASPFYYFMNIELLTEHYLEFLSLTGGCTGSSESTLMKLPHWWKSHVATYLFILTYFVMFIHIYKTRF